jgi:hypothetical protein
MLLIVLEAFGALAVLVLIVWWTMFSGRDKGEPPDHHLERERAAGETLWTVAEGIPPVTPVSTNSPTLPKAPTTPVKKSH